MTSLSCLNGRDIPERISNHVRRLEDLQVFAPLHLMGNFFSRIRLAIREFLALSTSYKALAERIKKSPGLPVQNSSLSFWTVPPSTIARHLSDLPAHADVIIIGSGLTGTSCARTLLDHASQRPLQVVMLDARDACTGASGRYVCCKWIS